MGDVSWVFVLVVGARFLLPLAILRYPLPAIVACLVLDGVDQTIFQIFDEVPADYQSYDKAMDVFYLAIAYLAMMRNWRSHPAFQVGRFLFFYRLVGVVVFEFSGARPLLLIFCNTFEYFFIAYEVIRLRWRPREFPARFWLGVAAAIWILVKLPQEYWLHIAELDLTDVLAQHRWAPPLLVALIVVVLAVVVGVLLPRMPVTTHTWQVRARSLPHHLRTGDDQTAWLAEHGRVWSLATLEKVLLVGLLAVVFGKILPDIEITELRLATGVTVVVLVNAAVTLAASRRAWTIDSILYAFVVRTALNVAMVAVVDVFLPALTEPGSVTSTLFFLTLITLITTLHDRYQPLATLYAAQRDDVGWAAALR